MPSVRTGLRAARTAIDRLTPLIAAAILVVMLAGCNTGQANEALRDMERDAENTPVMPLQQATRLAERYFPETATPTPSPPLYPFLGYLAVTQVVNPDGSPQGAFASFPTDAGTIFGVAKLHDASQGQIMTGIWSDQWGNQIGTSEVELGSSLDPQWVSFAVGLTPDLAPGPYALWVFADERRIGSMTFNLTAPGNAPQMYPELPPDPQVAAPTQPPRETKQSPTPEPWEQEGQQDGQEPQQEEWQEPEGEG